MTISINDLMGLNAGPHAKPASYYFTESNYQNTFAEYRKQKYILHKGARAPGSELWTETDELKLVDNLYNDWFGEPYSGGWGYDYLNLDDLPVKPLRKKELKPFKIDYETFPEIKLRLSGTVISIKGHPYLVNKVKPGVGDWLLCVMDVNNKYQVRYKDLTDLRSIPPMYVSGQQQTGWLCRIPGKVYQQGMNRHNTVIKSIDGALSLSGFDANSFMKNFRSKQTHVWNETLSNLIRGGDLSVMRLSDDVAVQTKADKIVACYKGRALGTIQDNEILVDDEDDLLQNWIEKSVQEVGFELRAN